MTSIDVVSPTIKVNGAPLATQVLGQLVSLRVQRGLRLPGRATLRFTDVGYGISTSEYFSIGQSVELGLYKGGMLMVGAVTGMSLEQQEGDHPDLVVVVDDAAHKLTRGTKIRTFLNVTFSEVVSRIAAEVGLTAACTATTEVHPYLLQADTDFALLDDLAGRTGYDWWVDGSVLHFAPPSSEAAVAQLLLGLDLHEFSVRASALLPGAATVSGWDNSKQVRIAADSQPAAASVSPDSTFATKVQNAKTLGPAVVATGSLTPLTQSEASTAGGAIRARWAAGGTEARGTCEANDKLKPGVAVTVVHAGPTSGTYHLTEVEHRYDSRGFRTLFVAGDRTRAGLADTLGGAARTGSFNIPGLVCAVVTNVADPEKVGRVKVKYPGVSDDIEGPWARIVTLGAGKNRGMVFQPEVDDEVLVGFEGGDPRRPVVLGGLFGTKSTMPDSIVKNNQVTSRRITSRLGHLIELADGTEPTTQHVLLQLQNTSHKIRLGADRLDVEVAAGKPILIKSGSASFEIDASENVTIKGNKISIEATNEVSVTANSKVALASQGQLDLQGTMVAVKGKANTSVEASGPLTLKGAMVAIN